MQPTPSHDMAPCGAAIEADPLDLARAFAAGVPDARADMTGEFYFTIARLGLDTARAFVPALTQALLRSPLSADGWTFCVAVRGAASQPSLAAIGAGGGGFLYVPVLDPAAPLASAETPFQAIACGVGGIDVYSVTFPRGVAVRDGQRRGPGGAPPSAVGPDADIAGFAGMPDIAFAHGQRAARIDVANATVIRAMQALGSALRHVVDPAALAEAFDGAAKACDAATTHSEAGLLRAAAVSSMRRDGGAAGAHVQAVDAALWSREAEALAGSIAGSALKAIELLTRGGMGSDDSRYHPGEPGEAWIGRPPLGRSWMELRLRTREGWVAIRLGRTARGERDVTVSIGEGPSCIDRNVIRRWRLGAGIGTALHCMPHDDVSEARMLAIHVAVASLHHGLEEEWCEAQRPRLTAPLMAA